MCFYSVNAVRCWRLGARGGSRWPGTLLAHVVVQVSGLHEGVDVPDVRDHCSAVLLVDHCLILAWRRQEAHAHAAVSAILPMARVCEAHAVHETGITIRCDAGAKHGAPLSPRAS